MFVGVTYRTLEGPRALPAAPRRCRRAGRVLPILIPVSSAPFFPASSLLAASAAASCCRQRAVRMLRASFPRRFHVLHWRPRSSALIKTRFFVVVVFVFSMRRRCGRLMIGSP